jgi:hypothetical protein
MRTPRLASLTAGNSDRDIVKAAIDKPAKSGTPGGGAANTPAGQL